MLEPTLVQRAYTAVLEHFIKTGRAPHYTELGNTLGLRPDDARHAQRAAAESSFSNVPTHFLVTIEGEQKWYGQ
jgi:hypothetical protein